MIEPYNSKRNFEAENFLIIFGRAVGEVGGWVESGWRVGGVGVGGKVGWGGAGGVGLEGVSGAGVAFITPPLRTPKILIR